MKTQRGNIAFDQIRAAHRQGEGGMFQMFGGVTAVEGNAPMFDATGSLIDSGKAASLIGTGGGSVTARS